MTLSLAKWKHILTIAHTVLKDGIINYKPSTGLDVRAEGIHFFLSEQHWKILVITRRSVWHASNQKNWIDLPPFLSLHLADVKKLLETLNKIKDKDIQDTPCTLVQKGEHAFFQLNDQDMYIGTLFWPCPEQFLERIPSLVQTGEVKLEVDCEQLTNGIKKLLVKTRAQWEPMDCIILSMQQGKLGLQYDSRRNYQSHIITIPGTWTNATDDYTILLNPRLLTSVISRMEGTVQACFSDNKRATSWQHESDGIFHHMAISALIPPEKDAT